MNGLYQCKKVDFIFFDERGSLVQLVHEGYTQVNVLYSKGGTERGAHYHKQSTEAFYVISGSVRVVLTKVGAPEIQTSVLFTKGDFFEIFPSTLHYMQFEENCIMIALYDKAIENADGTKDIYTKE